MNFGPAREGQLANSDNNHETLIHGQVSTAGALRMIAASKLRKKARMRIVGYASRGCESVAKELACFTVVEVLVGLLPEIPWIRGKPTVARKVVLLEERSEVRYSWYRCLRKYCCL